MPTPITQNKFKEIVENNIDLRYKMQIAFTQALDSLSNSSLGSLDNFEVIIDGVKFDYTAFDNIYINDFVYQDLSATVKKQAYDRLEKFMQISLARYNRQFNL